MTFWYVLIQMFWAFFIRGWCDTVRWLKLVLLMGTDAALFCPTKHSSPDCRPFSMARFACLAFFLRLYFLRFLLRAALGLSCSTDFFIEMRVFQTIFLHSIENDYETHQWKSAASLLCFVYTMNGNDQQAQQVHSKLKPRIVFLNLSLPLFLNRSFSCQTVTTTKWQKRRKKNILVAKLVFIVFRACQWKTLPFWTKNWNLCKMKCSRGQNRWRSFAPRWNFDENRVFLQEKNLLSDSSFVWCVPSGSVRKTLEREGGDPSVVCVSPFRGTVSSSEGGGGWFNKRKTKRNLEV